MDSSYSIVDAECTLLITAEEDTRAKLIVEVSQRDLSILAYEALEV